MSYHKKHITYGHTITPKPMFVGPPTPTQQPRLCLQCGLPVALVYRVYEKKIDERGVERVTRGQFEVAHFDNSTGRPIWTCEVPGLADHYRELAREEERETTRQREAAGYGGHTKDTRGMIHFEESVPGKDMIRVACGARGSLYTTLDTRRVTCSNCKQRAGKYATPNATTNIQPTQPNQGDSITDMSAQETNQPKKPMTAADIKAKIAASKAASAASAAKGGDPTSKPATPAKAKSATLLSEDQAPTPKATASGVTKKQVQAAKAPPRPKVLNLCGDGCGAACNARFIPGHDAKLHSWVKKIGDGRMSLSEIPAQVKDGMYPKVKQGSVKDGEGNISLAGVQPSVAEAAYLETLQGLGGAAATK